MCDPVTLTVAATAVAATGQIVSGIGKSQQANYAAGIADQNRVAASKNAADAQDQTALEAQRRYRALAQTKGAQQAAMAANGVDINYGTAVDIQRDTAMIGAEDVGQIYKAGAAKVKGYDTEAWNYAGEANAQRAKAKGAIVDGIFGAAGTALGGASQIAKYKGA